MSRTSQRKDVQPNLPYLHGPRVNMELADMTDLAHFINEQEQASETWYVARRRVYVPFSYGISSGSLGGLHWSEYVVSNGVHDVQSLRAFHQWQREQRKEQKSA